MHRRTFMQQAAFGTGVLAFGALPFVLARLLAPSAQAAPRRRVSLPGALADPRAFGEACIGCGQCVEVCPHPSRPIRVVAPSEGTVIQHRVAMTPEAG